ncbi:hypothetical protein [Paraburkholderia sp. MM5384-R2]|uniref:hypothetical protein n=1 Tax=Paraburkholderia sp. MM5384-R2 TaxID=2723097 RepID=UPI0016192927|nr:hypothetical protein [Paraburkholderia sp. MM5384-R2]MBB5495864.1 hypothetical protein [Paraburkholderia sp. MM5384-R2]
MNLKTITNALLASAACATFLAGCVTSGQGRLVNAPNRVNEVSVTAYQPLPTDVYVANVVDRDVVLVGGDTYIWVVGRDGVRHRQFYAHGDHRAEVFHRREELHRVMASHDGHLPEHPGGGEHPGGAHPPLGHPGGPAPAMAAHGQPPRADRHAAGPVRSAPATAAHGQPRRAVMHVAEPLRPAPAASAKRVSKDPKKS